MVSSLPFGGSSALACGTRGGCCGTTSCCLRNRRANRLRSAPCGSWVRLVNVPYKSVAVSTLQCKVRRANRKEGKAVHKSPAQPPDHDLTAKTHRSSSCPFLTGPTCSTGLANGMSVEALCAPAAPAPAPAAGVQEHRRWRRVVAVAVWAAALSLRPDASRRCRKVRREGSVVTTEPNIALPRRSRGAWAVCGRGGSALCSEGRNACAEGQNTGESAETELIDSRAAHPPHGHRNAYTNLTILNSNQFAVPVHA